ncbi:Zinc finger protein 132 [Ceratocystis fimbriata CBS 114723]|uniref:Zinc finger protein 132 n=1 Tax=Ceratocystis fimbriata CBS 114723 TaxID=1035309 RepID=A0A2C5X6N0_9PEZI|nr:Zinc finger protein 132 [Ceratocystis fimbriata CBS 114723]
MSSSIFYRCLRCDKTFRQLAHKQQHIRDSMNHHICSFCPSPLDFSTRDGLVSHLEVEHNVCPLCHQVFSTGAQRRQHYHDRHNICLKCGRSFKSPSNLDSHKIVHVERNIDCPGCNRMFRSESAMVLHLEAGTCASQTDLSEVTELAHECRQSQYYVSYRPGFDFECPTCDTPFVYMSGLLQHVERDSCTTKCASKMWFLALAVFEIVIVIVIDV